MFDIFSITWPIVGTWIGFLIDACATVIEWVTAIGALLAMAPVPVQHASHNDQTDQQKWYDDKCTNGQQTLIQVSSRFCRCAVGHLLHRCHIRIHFCSCYCADAAVVAAAVAAVITLVPFRSCPCYCCSESNRKTFSLFSRSHTKTRQPKWTKDKQLHYFAACIWTVSDWVSDWVSKWVCECVWVCSFEFQFIWLMISYAISREK